MRQGTTMRQGFTGRGSLSLLLALVVVGSWLVAVGPASASPAAVTGQLAMRDRVALSPDAVAVITLVDQDAGPDAGTIVAEQRIDDVSLPTEFAVSYDTDQINPDHAYALFASVIDGTSTYQTIEPVPVITGGPTSDIVLTVVGQPTGSAQVTGTIVRSDKTALSSEAVAIAALINADTGTLIARQVIPTVTETPIPFAIPVLTDIVDPTATYVVKAAIDDVGATWEGKQGVPAIVGGAIVPDIEVPVTLVAAPSPSVAPSAAPSGSPSAPPSESPAPSITPAPTATPTPTATPEPTPSPTASPEPSASESPSPTAAPTKGVIEGTLTYNEGHQLSANARAVVVLADVSTGPDLGSVIASTTFTPTGPPAPYKLTYAFKNVNDKDTYRLFAGIADGDLAWVTPIGVTVPVPEPSLTGIELPLAFRPDLLKGAVTGLITGNGLDASNPGSLGTVMVVRADTGETVGFQFLSSITEVPIPFSAPYDPASLAPGADYELFAWVYDGSAEWANEQGIPVITNGNPTADVSVVVTQKTTPAPSPTATPSPPPSPSASAEPTPEPGRGIEPGLVLIVLLMVGGGAAVVFAVANNKA
jgi:uncharacterized lipoprotein YbaY